MSERESDDEEQNEVEKETQIQTLRSIVVAEISIQHAHPIVYDAHNICKLVRNLRTFALIVYAHPYCARNSCRNATPRHASSARAEETFQPHIGRVAVAITSLAVF